ncbi:hypothetical protein PHBOTO_003441 [Pseudozyma hubeiensis]|nr:hypothetical protein PHBOTO_003441 [Pseudozyma hubeiensis]
MSSEVQSTPEAHNADEQLVMEQERVHEERETSFHFQREALDAQGSTSASAAAALAAVEDTSTQSAQEDVADNSEEAEAAAVEQETATAVIDETVHKPSPRSSRKSRTSGTAPSTAASSEPSKKKARKSTITTDPAAESDVNVRLDRLRQALFRFLDLIEHRATRSSFVKALPHIDEESVEALRQQFVAQLKAAIIDESEKLIESNDLEAKLASLHRLTQEADARYQAGYREGAVEIMDVWRKEMDLETAVSARAIPDQERRVEILRKELEAVRKENQVIHRELLQTRARSDAIQTDARESLNALESAIKGLEATPDMQKQLRQTMDDLLQDLGARV